MKRTISIGLVVGIAGLAAPALAQCTTEVGGLICSDTVWDLAGSPYCVTQAAGGTIVIGCDATLTIEAGVEVRFDAGLEITVGSAAFGPGTLVARGTQEAKIRFTSNTFNQPGDWARIYFTDYAVNATFQGDVYEAGCVLEHVIVEYAGADTVPAVTAANAAPWLASCVVRDNAERGIYVNGENAPGIRIEYCQVSDHVNSRGIHIERGSGHRLTGNTITGNRGGLHFYYTTGNTLTDNTITDNTTSGSGGGIYFGNYSGSNTLSGNTITANSASGSGGGIYYYYSGSNTLSENTICANSASGSGGGIFFDHGSGSNTLSGNCICDNVASGNGGGIWFRYDSGGNTLTGELITDNGASGEGGAIYFDGPDNCTLSDCVIVRNRMTANGTTGGIYVTNDAQGISLAGDPDNEIYNTICLNDGYQIRNNNAFYADGRNDVDARYVIWHTCDTQEIQQLIYDHFDDPDMGFVIWYPFIESIAGDLDGDLDVDHSDLGILLADWGCAGSDPGDCPGDCDFDADTDHSDLGILLGHWGEVCP